MKALSLMLLVTSCCVHTPARATVDAGEPGKHERQMSVRFPLPDMPKNDAIYICGIIRGEFSCVDYEVFLSTLKKLEGGGGGEEPSPWPGTREEL